MREREKFGIAESKERIFSRDLYHCQNCGQSVFIEGTPQLAHIISQAKTNIKKYGKNLIHSDYNIKSACSLHCNSALSCGKSNEPAEAERIRLLIEQDKKAGF